MLHIGYSCGPAQLVALGAIPYNLGCIGTLKHQLAQERAQQNPSDEKIRKIQKDLFACWKAINFHEYASIPVFGTLWETEAYWKKNAKKTELLQILSRNPDAIINDHTDLETRLKALFAECTPLDYNPDFARFNEIKERAFGLIAKLYEPNPNNDDFIKSWPTIRTDLEKLDLT